MARRGRVAQSALDGVGKRLQRRAQPAGAVVKGSQQLYSGQAVHEAEGDAEGIDGRPILPPELAQEPLELLPASVRDRVNRTRGTIAAIVRADHFDQVL